MFNKINNHKGTSSLKWDVPENELPRWVADMDFHFFARMAGLYLSDAVNLTRMEVIFCV